MSTTLTRPHVLTIVLAGLLAAGLALAPPGAGQSNQPHERQVVKSSYKNEPIEIVGLKSKKGAS